ncbi:NAD(P)(+) transhydrogenase (Re/Si-specific) subunit beta, partial [Zavarzinia sp.]|uniref:NAD(P)(+) transhydrogenase (Re/Si-specific) subunit beta n=1 Tax=Zavarzinia sp. TaxID=2027920 RepID=UPI00356A0781
MNANLASLLYLVSGVLFILALRGLSSPATSRSGNRYGMIGMTIAVVTTLLSHQVLPNIDPLTVGMIVLALAIGGGIGAVIAKRVAMTS